MDCAPSAATVEEPVDEVRVLSNESREVLPKPTPTAGTFPSSFSAELEASESTASTGEPAGLVEAVLDADALAVVEAVGAPLASAELSRERRDVFPAPIPTAGTFPSSLPFEVNVAVVVAPGITGVMPVAPVALAWIK